MDASFALRQNSTNVVCKWLCSVRTGRPKSFTSFTLNLQKPRRLSKASQSQSQRRRQLHPTRPLEDRPSGRACTNHLRGLPFPSLGQGDLAQGSLAVAGAVVELLLVSVSALSVSASQSQSHRACSPHTHASRAAHTQTTTLTASPSLDGTCSLIHRAHRERRGGGRAWAEYGTLSPYHHPTSNSRPTRPLFVHALTTNIQHTTSFLLPSPSRSTALSNTLSPVPTSLRRLCAASYSITPQDIPETHQK